MAAAQAVEYDAQGKPLPASPQGVEYDAEGKPIGAAPSAPAKPSMLQTIGQGALDFGKGIAKGGLNTIRGIGNLEGKIPGLKSLMPGDVQDYLGSEGEKMNATHGTAQAIGKGTEQAAEFMLPGGAEEKLAAKAPAMLRPLARIGASALSSGTVNKVQGGDFGTGAALGAGGSAIGQGMKAAAPIVAEGALGITKAMRGRGRDIGQAVLDETKGIRPESVAESAKGQISSLYGERQQLLDSASAKPNPVKGLLPAPKQEIPLAKSADVEGRLSQPIRLTQTDRPGPPMLQAPSLSTPMASGHQVEFPERLASGDTGIRQTDFGSHPGMGQSQYIGQIPGERGGTGQPQGVLLRPGATGGGPIPEMLPNASASLRPARNVLSEAVGKARGMEAPTLHGQVSNMSDFLHRGAVSGEAIPENITPSHLGRLQQGFSDEHLTWNPATHQIANAAGQRAYGAMTGELGRVAPETLPLNSRISNLIPAQRAAESVSRNAPTLQRAAGRFGAHTGALTLGAAGAYEGRREGGIPGMIAGGVTGVLAPELIASPEGQMLVARSLNKAGSLKPAVGGLLQANRKKGDR
jgi:hypothetical protein